MPKKSPIRNSVSMRKTTMACLLTVLVLGGGWWGWNHSDRLHDFLGDYIERGEFLTLEARYTPDQIIEQHRRELLSDASRQVQEPALRFAPYLLMEIKYAPTDKRTREDVILWSLADGEMVIDTEQWETTHGFEDALRADATRQDFRIMQALAKNQGTMTYDQLLQELRVEEDILDAWLSAARQKQLITLRGNQIQLHFQNPKISVAPFTRIHQALVTKPYSHAKQIPRHYSRSQIERLTKATFGPDFAIRHIKEVFVPIYEISVLNPDGTIFTTSWNALNGQRIAPKYQSVVSNL